MSQVVTVAIAPNLSALTVTINEEYRLANEAAADALIHAVACGEALLAARELMPSGLWTAWVEQNLDIGYIAATCWCRLARNKALLDLNQETGVKAALRHLRELGVDRPRTDNGQSPTFDVDEARRLRESGLSWQRVADEFGVSRTSIRYQLQPGFRQSKRKLAAARIKRQAKERQALIQLDRVKAVKKLGGDVSLLYEWLRKGAVILDRLIVESEDWEYRSAMREAQSAFTKAEAAIVKALRLQ